MNQEQVALSALRSYPITPSRVAFLRHNENMVFQVVDERTRRTYLLRIHTPLTKAFEGERLRTEGIVSELLWLEALAEETNLVLQHPVRSKEGTLVTMISGEQEEIPCSLLHWIEADPFSAVPSSDHVERLGSVIATLHTHACTWSAPEFFDRPVHDLAFHHRQVNKLAEGVQDGIIQAVCSKIELSCSSSYL